MKVRVAILAAALMATAVTFWGCEWSGGSDNGFNTSRAGLNVNISGVYNGSLSGGKAVSMTSGATISRFTFIQNGNSLEVIDSNGQKYRGTVGAPGAVIDLADAAASGTIPAGALLASYQVFFSGTDGVAARDIELTGIIDVVTVNDVFGDSTEQTITSSSQTDRTSDSDSTTGNTSESNSDSSSSIQLGSEFASEPGGGEIITPGPGDGDFTGDFDVTNSGSEDFEQNSDSANSSNSENNQSSTVSSQSSQGNDTSRTISTTFELTEANSQFRLRGTWIEEGGFVAEVEARSTGSGLLAAENLPADGTDGNN